MIGRRALLRRALLFGALGGVAACRDTVEAEKERHDALWELDPAGEVPAVLTIGVTPTVGDESVDRLRPLIEYLGRSLSVQARGLRADSYDHLADLVAQQKVDLGIFSPLAYVRAQQRTPVVALATATRRGSPTYIGYLVSRRTPERPPSLDDLRGRRVAWVHRSSTSGYLYPRAMLHHRGIDPDQFFSAQRFVGDHAAAVAAVVAGEADCAATASMFIDRDSGSIVPGAAEVEVVGKTAHIPLDCVVVHRRIQRGLARSLRDSLLALVEDPAGSRGLWTSLGFDGFVRPMHARYTEIAAVQDTYGKPG